MSLCTWTVPWLPTLSMSKYGSWRFLCSCQYSKEPYCTSQTIAPTATTICYSCIFGCVLYTVQYSVQYHGIYCTVLVQIEFVKFTNSCCMSYRGGIAVQYRALHRLCCQQFTEVLFSCHADWCTVLYSTILYVTQMVSLKPSY